MTIQSELKARIAQLREFGRDAVARNDDEWGSDRQINAENTFFEELANDGLIDDKFMDGMCGASNEEIIKEAMLLLDQVERDCTNSSAPLYSF